MRERGLSAPIWTGGDIHRQHPKGICTGRSGVGDGKCADSLRDRGQQGVWRAPLGIGQ